MRTSFLVFLICAALAPTSLAAEKLPGPFFDGLGDLLGLEQSLRRQGKTQSADLVLRQFEAAWKRADVTLALEWF
jgi:hypothetical protein